jgi:hypothetical protein
VRTVVVPHLGTYFGVAVRIQGLRRYYGVRVMRSGELQIVRVRDRQAEVLASSACTFAWEVPLSINVTVHGREIAATVGGASVEARDDTQWAFMNGGVGLFVHEGAISTDAIEVTSAI